jgi:hypothetical protein
MALLIRRSIPNRLLIVALGLILFSVGAPLALAQHSYGHIAGGTAHIASPPIYRAPASSAPAYHAPIPRVSTFRSTDAIGTAHFIPPRRPIRPFPPVVLVYDFPFVLSGPLWGFSCLWAMCDWPGSVGPWMVDYTTVSSPGPVNYVAQVYEAPVFYSDYDYDYGEESAETPQLYLKDGSILNVRDYWLTNDQLHFRIIQEYGAKPVEEAIPFEALDLQKTVDVNTQRGFRFMLRNEPFEQYMRDHPEGPPPVLTPPQQ